MLIIKFLNYPSFSANAFNNPERVCPPFCNAEITFWAGACKAPMISPTSSALDLSLLNASNESSPIYKSPSIDAAFNTGFSNPSFLRALITFAGALFDSVEKMIPENPSIHL